MLADTITPVNIYLKLRDVYAGSFLLESSDYHGQENSLSFVCCDPIATFQVSGMDLSIKYPDGSSKKETLQQGSEVIDRLDDFRNCFEVAAADSKYISGGLFGYMAYDAVRYFEDVTIEVTNKQIPDILYKVFKYVIVIDHFSNELVLFENSLTSDTSSGLKNLEKIIFSNRFSTFQFSSSSEETSNISDEEYLKMVSLGISHCKRGDVFQIVFSRRFTS